MPIEERRGSSHPMIPGFDDNGVIPGRTAHQDFGVHASSGKLEVYVPYATNVLADLREKWRRVPPEPVLVSPDGVTVYLCAWDEGRSFEPEPKKYYPGEFGLKMRFKVIDDGEGS